MSTESPDWVRLHKALAVEAERGFTDLVGNNTASVSFSVSVLANLLTCHQLSVAGGKKWQLNLPVILS